MRILLPIVKDEATASFYTNFHAGLAKALRELGHEPLIFAYESMAASSPAEQQSLFSLLARQPCEAVFDLCCWAHCLSHTSVWDGSAAGEPIFDSQDMAYVGMLFDQPWFQPLPAVRSGALYATVPDLGNAEQLALIYPEVRLRDTVFAPPAIDADNDRSSAVQKDIALLYIGNLNHEGLARSWRGLPDGLLYDDVADLALAEPELPLHQALDRVREAHGRPVDPQLALDVLRKIEFFRRTQLRLIAVRAAAAAGVPMVIVGYGWDRIELPSHVSLHPFVDYHAMLAFAARAHVCLDASTYPQGANDRIFNYMLNGAVCFTNARGYLGHVYGPGSGLRFYSPNESAALAGELRELLAAPARLREEAERGRSLTLAAQTWRNRVEVILDALA